MEWLTAQGVRFAPAASAAALRATTSASPAPQGSEEFPVSGEGVLIELAQAPPEVVEAFAKLG